MPIDTGVTHGFAMCLSSFFDNCLTVNYAGNFRTECTKSLIYITNARNDLITVDKSKFI